MGKSAPERPDIGQRIRAIRRRRGLGLATAAGLAGISKQYLSMIELGTRSVDRRGLLEDIATAIGCSIIDLTGEPYVPSDGPSATALSTIPPIQLALLDCDLGDVPDQPARPLDELARGVRVANLHRDRTQYGIAGRELGALLTELQVTVAVGGSDERRRALRVLVEACLVTYEICKNLGHPQLALEAARRGRDAAMKLGDPTLLGFARWYNALAMMRLGARRRASSVLATTVDELSSAADPASSDTFGAEVYGLVHLTSALEAARSGRADDAAGHLSEARGFAERTGEQNGLLMHFGPSNVTAWTLSIGVELGEGGAAYEAAQRKPADLDVLDSPNRRSAWHYDLARALAQEHGPRDREAVQHLDIAERIAPQRLHNDPIARELLFSLDTRAKTIVWELGSLKHRFGLN